MLKKVIILSVLVLMCYIPSFADDAIRIEIDGKPLVMEVAPQIQNGRALVPFKAIFEGLGLKIDWIGENRVATAYNETMNVSIKIEAGYGNINGELIPLEVPGKIVAGRTLVPVKFISEAFGNAITWNAQTRLISIKSGFKTYAYTETLPAVESLEKMKLILEYAGKYTHYIYPLIAEKASSEQSMPQGAASTDTYSTTNVQVESVDEADIVKTDGNYIYQLRMADLKITDITTASMKTVATIKFDDYLSASEFYLYDNKLVIIGTRQMFYPYIEPIDGMRMESFIPRPMPEPKTSIYFYDIKNPMQPRLIRKFEGLGSYMTSRLTSGKLYLIMNKWLRTYEITAENVLPAFTDTLIGLNAESIKTSTIGFDDIRYFPDTVESNLMITLGFDLDLIMQEPHKKAYLGNSTNVYADTESLIIAMDRYHYNFQVQEQSFAPMFTNTTELYKFNLVNGMIDFSAKGTLPGRVLNQFSMDAYNGDYRIATTSGETWMDTSQNNIYVLNSNLQLKGKLEGLAQGERIYSARFIGDRAYLVTFKQVDPFYVIDMENPYLPKVLGYLKIPGFSDYLHPYDANTIIGFGRETIETANGPILGGLKIAMFDVTDVTKPTEKSKVVLGSSGSWSQVLYNHKALLFSKEKSLFALPVSLYSGVGRDNLFSFQGAYVYSVDPVNGFILRGTSTHLSQAEVDDSILKWYDTTKEVSRIIWAGDSLYTLSEYGIESHNLNTMNQKNFLIY